MVSLMPASEDSLRFVAFESVAILVCWISLSYFLGHLYLLFPLLFEFPQFSLSSNLFWNSLKCWNVEFCRVPGSSLCSFFFFWLYLPTPMAVNMTSAARNYLPNFQTKHTTILKPHSLGCLTDPSNSNYLCLNSPSLPIQAHSPVFFISRDRALSILRARLKHQELS